MELGVLRIVGGASVPLNRTPCKPPPPAAMEASDADRLAQDAVLFATAVDSRIAGRVLGRDVDGVWAGALTLGQARLSLGEVPVARDGVFTTNSDDLPAAVYSGGRAVLTLVRDGRRALGFLALQDSLDLGHRLGPAIGPLMRMATGEGDDQDLAAILEWMAMNPDLSLAAWRTASPGREPQPSPVFMVDPAAEMILSDGDVLVQGTPTLTGGVGLSA